MSHTVPKASDILSKEPGDFSFEINLWELIDLWKIMKDARYTLNRIPCKETLLIKLFQSNLSMCARQAWQKGRHEQHDNIGEPKLMVLWYDRKSSH